MKTTHQCPKCGSQEIYNNEASTKVGERSMLPISSWKSAFTSVYVCVSCGYFEEYLAESEFKETKMIEKIKSNWKKGE
jgi:predicted nucleic-acid-binding Zn-ribbon protein